MVVRMTPLRFLTAPGGAALRRLFGVTRFEPTLPSRYDAVHSAMRDA